MVTDAPPEDEGCAAAAAAAVLADFVALGFFKGAFALTAALGLAATAAAAAFLVGRLTMMSVGLPPLLSSRPASSPLLSARHAHRARSAGLRHHPPFCLIFLNNFNILFKFLYQK